MATIMVERASVRNGPGPDYDVLGTAGRDEEIQVIGVSEEVEQMERLLKWFTPYEILKMSTGNATELLQMSGPRNPYPGVLGRVEEEALADLLLVAGNPLEDIKSVTDRNNIKIIMKDGKIYKNTLN